MTERYRLKSEFLRAVIADIVPLCGWAGEMNRRQLIALTSDADLTNRD